MSGIPDKDGVSNIWLLLVERIHERCLVKDKTSSNIPTIVVDSFLQSSAVSLQVEHEEFGREIRKPTRRIAKIEEAITSTTWD